MRSKTQPGKVTRADCVRAVLQHRVPDRIVYAPNYWQWFTHHRNHGLLPEALRDCGSQLELIRHLGLDVFSRNIYCDPTRYWFGGLAEEVWEGVEVEVNRRQDGCDIVTEKTIRTKVGTLTERLRYIFNESTLVQEKPLLDSFAAQTAAFEAWVCGRRWRFNRRAFEQWQQEVGDDGLINAGELFSPLKMLPLAAGAADVVSGCADTRPTARTAQRW